MGSIDIEITGGKLPPAETLLKANQSLADWHLRLQREIRELREECGELHDTNKALLGRLANADKLHDSLIAQTHDLRTENDDLRGRLIVAQAEIDTLRQALKANGVEL